MNTKATFKYSELITVHALWTPVRIANDGRRTGAVRIANT